jgi:hypothetical protein
MEAAQTYGAYMNTVPAESDLATRQATGFSRVKTILIEPFLIVVVATFWLIALPFVAALLVCVKVGGALVAIESGSSTQSNPLFLRHSVPEGSLILLQSRESIMVGLV